MKYILSNDIALRSFILVPYAYYIKNYRNAFGLKKEEYEILKLCDGNHDIEDSLTLADLVKKGLCRKASENESLSSWQKEKICDNRYFPAMNWMITGKCNYNCLHCFNASDNNRLQSEFTLDEANKLILEAEKCGINAITITGGEPMLSPIFIDIIKNIYEHGMYVNEINTNGSFITKEILNELKSIGCFPLIKISFDGIGHHDYIRNKIGATDEVINAIKISLENGFDTKVQTNINRLNKDAMIHTAKMLDELGVGIMRIIRTTESPRWKENANNATLDFDEYFDTMLDFLKEYISTDCKMDIDIWSFIYLWKNDKTYTSRAYECFDDEYRDTIPVCRGNRGMVAVAANGNLYPCHQLSGQYEKMNICLGNVKKDGLQKLLKDSDYLKNVCTTVKDLKDHNTKCASCKWFKYCCGGCRAIGTALNNDIYGSDISRCVYFNNGYDDKIKKVLKGYELYKGIP